MKFLFFLFQVLLPLAPGAVLVWFYKSSNENAFSPLETFIVLGAVFCFAVLAAYLRWRSKTPD